MAIPSNSGDILEFLGFVSLEDFAVRRGPPGNVYTLEWFSVSPEPTDQEINDAGNDLTVVNGQVFSVWLAENGGDPIITAKKRAKIEIDTGTNSVSRQTRAILLLIMDELNLVRRNGHGGLYRDAAVTVQSIPNNTFTKLTALTGATAMATGGDVVSDTVGGELVLPRAGHWQVGFSLSFSGSNNTEYEFAVFGNGTKAEEVTSTRALGTGGAAGIGSLSAVGILNAPIAGIALDLRAGQAESGNRDVTVERLQLWAVEVTDLPARTPGQVKSAVEAAIDSQG